MREPLFAPRRGVLELLFPPKCPFCGKLLKDGEHLLCARCLPALPYTGGGRGTNGSFFARCVSPLYYEGSAREALLRFKFSGRRAYAPCFGELIAGCVKQALFGEYDVATWVPVSAMRLRKRGYSQSKLLAREAARLLETKAVCTLRKRRNTPAQSTLRGQAARKANVSGAFAVQHPARISGKRILLIDDVVTSGATLAECARLLLSAGAAQVVCATLCKARG